MTSLDYVKHVSRKKRAVTHFQYKKSRPQRLQLVHSDICELVQTKSFGGALYFVTFIDDYLRCVKVYCIPSKDQALEKFLEFKALVINKMGLKIKTLQTNRGGKYTSAKFKNDGVSVGDKHRHNARDWDGEAEGHKRNMGILLFGPVLTGVQGELQLPECAADMHKPLQGDLCFTLTTTEQSC